MSRSHFNISPAVFSPHKKGAGTAHLEAQGHAPQVDYAPISLEVVKALEVEFGKVLDGFRKTVNGRAFSYNEGEISDRGLSDFLQGEKPPTLGTIAYLPRSRSQTHLSFDWPFTPTLLDSQMEPS